MKKLSKLLFVLAMAAIIVSNIRPCITRADDSTPKIVYANVPEDWKEPCIWAWGSDGTNAFEAWPGQKMTADPNNSGWYYTYVPSFVSSIIVNANEGTVQTTDLASNSLDSWITVTSAEDAVLVNEKQTEGDVPEYVATYKVNAKVPDDWVLPSIWAWSAPDGTNLFANWPGQELNASADGWYSFEVPEWVNSIIVNANAGGVQTSDITVEAKDLWIVVNSADSYDLYYEQPDIGQEMITVHAKTPADWLFPSLWAWSAPDGTNVFANWPGQELTLADDWYCYDIPAWVNSIIINGNLGTVQTTDVSIEGKDLWIVVNGPEDFEVFYEEPDVKDLEQTEPTSTPSPEPTATNTPEPTKQAATPTEEVKDTVAEANTDSVNPVVIVIIVVAAAAVIAGAVVIIIKKKKQQS